MPNDIQYNKHIIGYLFKNTSIYSYTISKENVFHYIYSRQPKLI